MKISSLKISVVFEDPFWIGVFEKTAKDGYSVAKVTFGAEPTDQEVHQFILQHYDALKFSPPLREKSEEKNLKLGNFKRRQRDVKKELKKAEHISKAHAALKTVQEQKKIEKQKITKILREEKQAKKFELKQIKKKIKHKGH